MMEISQVPESPLHEPSLKRQQQAVNPVIQAEQYPWRIAFKVLFKQEKLGLSFKQADAPDTGNGYYAMEVNFLLKNANGGAGQSEMYNNILKPHQQHLCIRKGIRVSHVNDFPLHGLSFIDCCEKMKSAARPVKLRFIDPEAGYVDHQEQISTLISEQIMSAKAAALSSPMHKEKRVLTRTPSRESLSSMGTIMVDPASEDGMDNNEPDSDASNSSFRLSARRPVGRKSAGEKLRPRLNRTSSSRLRRRESSDDSEAGTRRRSFEKVEPTGRRERSIEKQESNGKRSPPRPDRLKARGESPELPVDAQDKRLPEPTQPITPAPSTVSQPSLTAAQPVAAVQPYEGQMPLKMELTQPQATPVAQPQSLYTTSPPQAQLTYTETNLPGIYVAAPSMTMQDNAMLSASLPPQQQHLQRQTTYNVITTTQPPANYQQQYSSPAGPQMANINQSHLDSANHGRMVCSTPSYTQGMQNVVQVTTPYGDYAQPKTYEYVDSGRQSSALVYRKSNPSSHELEGESRQRLSEESMERRRRRNDDDPWHDSNIWWTLGLGLGIGVGFTLIVIITLKSQMARSL